MKYDFDRITERRGTASVKYDAMDKMFGRSDLIPMWVADMDFEAPDFIKNALTDRVDHGIYGYGIRDDAWHESIVNWVKRRNNWDIDRQWIDFTPGVVVGFTLALRALTDEGDGIVINPPVYHPFASQIKANDRKVVDSPLVERNGKYEFDFEDLDNKLAQAKALLFCNPHNPTGRVFTREELLRVGELCVKHNVVIISDEIHSDLIQPPHSHVHIASLSPELAERTVTLLAPTKTFNLAGLSSSVAITPDAALHRRLRREIDRIHVDMGTVFGTTALTAAYNNGDEWLDELNRYIGGNMQLAADFFDANIPQIKTVKSEGTYMLWLDCRALGMPQEELKDFFINKARVAVSDGEIFGEQGTGFFRMVMATQRSVVEKALAQILEAHRSLNLK